MVRASGEDPMICLSVLPSILEVKEVLEAGR